MLSSSAVKDDPLYINVIKQDIVKCDVVLKGYLQVIIVERISTDMGNAKISVTHKG